jgi:hypothetical protein
MEVTPSSKSLNSKKRLFFKLNPAVDQMFLSDCCAAAGQMKKAVSNHPIDYADGGRQS